MLEILFVNPDVKLTNLYGRRLGEHFRVHTAVDGLSAVRMVRAVTPKAIISDYHLPLMSGKSLIYFVRNHKPTQSSPFIFLTKHDFDHDALSLGANDWIALHAATPDLVIERMHYHLKLKQPYV
jgi:DNA-binding response OmpR family regulator